MTIVSKRAFIADQTAFKQTTSGAVKSSASIAPLSKADEVRLAIMKIRAGVITVS